MKVYLALSEVIVPDDADDADSAFVRLYEDNTVNIGVVFSKQGDGSGIERDESMRVSLEREKAIAFLRAALELVESGSHCGQPAVKVVLP